MPTRSKTLTFILLMPLVASLSGCTRCIVEGTLILTPGGSILIEDIRPGDEVLSSDGQGALVVSRVLATRAASARHYLEIAVDGHDRALSVTAAHPIATPEGWRRAGTLAVGDSIQTVDGLRRVASIAHRFVAVRVYDLRVDPAANFFAGGVLVHNKKYGPKIPDKPPELMGLWYGYTHGSMDKPWFARLELDATGTGFFGYAPTGGDVVQYRVVRTTIEHAKPYRYEATLMLEPLTRGATSATLKGPVALTRTDLGLALGMPDVPQLQAFTFVREAQALKGLEWSKRSEETWRRLKSALPTTAPSTQP